MTECVLLDVDTGHDDAVAICMAWALKKLEVLGITTVAGNQTVDKTTLNTLKVLSLIGAQNIPVAKGWHKPLVRPLETGEEIHGATGLDGATLPAPSTNVINKHAVRFLAETLERAPQPVVVIATGPQTNIASLLISTPDITTKIKRIVFMGGAVCGGNRTAVAEFNIYVDPEAAKIVLNSGVPITMIGLDVTEKTSLTLTELNEILGTGMISQVFKQLLAFYAERRKKARGLPGVVLHDAVAVAAVIDPALIRTELLPVDVETEGRLTRGMTVVDRRPRLGKQGNVDVALDIDVESFKQMLKMTFSNLDDISETRV